LPASAAETPAAQQADPCLTNKCRPADAAVIFVDVDGKKKSAQAGKLPYTNVDKAAVTVTLGETLKFSADSDGKILSNVAFVEAAKATDADPAPLAATVKKGSGQIVLKFLQTKDPATNSRLVVTHNFEGTLVFDAYVLPFGAPGYKQSPTCPVAAGKSVSTTWYAPMLVATLAGFHIDNNVKPVTASEILCQ
jgi:hypothetical protein